MPPRHIALAVVITVVWGVNFVVIDVGLDSFPPLLFAALRFTLVAFPAVLFLRRPDVPVRYLVGVGLFMSTGQFALLFSGMEAGMPAGLASLVLQLQAVFTIALAVAFLGERPGPAQLAGAVIAFCGIGIIAADRAVGVPAVAMALCVAAGLSWGIGNVIMRVAQPKEAIPMLVWSSLIAPPVLLVLSLLLEDPSSARIDLGGSAALLYVVIGATFFGFGAWTWLLKRHPASTVAPFTLLVPPVGIVSAWIALAEQPTPLELTGVAVAMAGLALTTGAIGARPRARLRPAYGGETGPTST